MSENFDAQKIEGYGWRQGSVLAGEVDRIARNCSPEDLELEASDWIVLVSHDCDIANHSLRNEPLVEVIRAREIDVSKLKC